MTTTMTAALDSSEIDELTTEQCWEYLAGAGLGRLALRRGEGIDIFPINYLVHQGGVFFRTAPGSKLIDLTHAPQVAFEIDGGEGRMHWSVVVHGTAERLHLESDILDSGLLALRTMSPTTKWNYVRIAPTEVSGRRFTSPRTEV